MSICMAGQLRQCSCTKELSFSFLILFQWKQENRFNRHGATSCAGRRQSKISGGCIARGKCFKNRKPCTRASNEWRPTSSFIHMSMATLPVATSVDDKHDRHTTTTDTTEPNTSESWRHSKQMSSVICERNLFIVSMENDARWCVYC